MSFLLWAKRIAKGIGAMALNALTDDNSVALLDDSSAQLTDDS